VRNLEGNQGGVGHNLPVGNRGFTSPQRTLTHDGPLVFWLAALADKSALGLDTANGRAEGRISAYDFVQWLRVETSQCESMRHIDLARIPEEKLRLRGQWL
jgi:hypothetical protein